jgi:Zn-dependent protease
MLGRASLRLGRIKSIEINVNVTWLVVFALLVYWLKTGYVAETASHLGRGAAWAVSGIGAGVLFGSVLAHELSHSLTALRNGLPIRKITLFIFGGVAHMEAEPATPGVELKMAIAGPVASLVIAAVSGVIRFGILKDVSGSIPAIVIEYAFYANTVLACFNLVPGFPLDGGRVLRAILWKATGNFVRSTLIASGIGRVFGLALVFLGVSMAIANDAPAFLWPMFIGIFIERLAYLSGARVQAGARRRPAGPAPTLGPGFSPLTSTPRPVFFTEKDTR